MLLALVAALSHLPSDVTVSSDPLRRLEAAYVQAWQDNDAPAFMATISSDAVRRD